MASPSPIDRRSLVQRHNPVLSTAEPTAALTVGNGDAAMTVDVTGLQTFTEFHELRPDPHRVPHGRLDSLPRQRPRAFHVEDFQIPLRTQSSWALYSATPRISVDPQDATTSHPTDRGAAPYLDRNGLLRPNDDIPSEFAAGAYLHFNPRRAHQGRLALAHRDRADGSVNPDMIEHIRTELDLWSGTITASYELEGQPVSVTTVADPAADRFAVKIVSDALDEGWGIAWIFDDQPDALAAFEEPLTATTRWEKTSSSHWLGHRTVEDLQYSAEIRSTGEIQEHGDGLAALMTSSTGSLDVVVQLYPAGSDLSGGEDSSAEQILASAATWWEQHWTQGAVVSLEGSADPRAPELERRIVLSQYLTAVNCAGATPPAETGLTYNTWSGKFHLEMHWWHAAHFPLWGRGHLLERSLPWYHRILRHARETAQTQGYEGARWPKQTDPTGRESPSNIGVFLLWQQPHLIYLLSLLADEGRAEDFLQEHLPLIEATADFMADFSARTDAGFELPPPLVPAQESYLATRATNRNPTFELAYWRWALGTASDWCRSAGGRPDPRWDEVATAMVSPAVLEDGTYAALDSSPQLIREDHPSHLMALGWVPDTGFIDRDIMRATLDAVQEKWELQSTWGWDYPVMAMAAIELGDLSNALDSLLMESPKNTYLRNGHTPQLPGFLSLYLPANGGLLAAVAHLVGALEQPDAVPGWSITAEGFPAPQSTRRSLHNPGSPEAGSDESEEVQFL